MKKLTIVTDERGELVGAMHGHAPRPDRSKGPETGRDEFRAGIMAGPGQRLHEIEVPDELASIKDPDKFGAELMRHVRKEGLLA
jgi:hypothetical protein